MISQFLLDRFGPSQPESVRADDLAPYEGIYRGVRRSHTTWEAFLGLLMNPPSRVVAADSGLIVDGRGPYRPIGNDTFQRDDDATGVGKIAFSLDSNGRAGQMFHFPGLDVAHRVDGMHIGQFLPAFLVGFATVFSGLLCVFYPFGPAGPAGLSRLKWMPPAMLVVLIAGICAVVIGHPPEEDPFFGIGRSFLHPWRFAALNIATNLIAFGSVVLAVVSVLAWRQRYWGSRWGGWVVRSHFTILCLGWLALLPILVQLNLIGWHWPG